jgi:polysaccharide biosynthesis transport protein
VTVPIRSVVNGLDRHPVPPGQESEPLASNVAAALSRHRRLIFLTALLLGGLGAGYSKYATPVYEAISSLGYERESVDLPQLVEPQYSENVITTELEILRGRSAAEAVVDSLPWRVRLLTPRRGQITEFFSVLHVSPVADTGTFLLRPQGGGMLTVTRAGADEVLGSVRIATAATIGGAQLVPSRAALNAESLRLHIDSREQAIRRLRSALVVSRPSVQVDLITIRVRSPDPTIAAASANLLAANCVTARRTLRRSRTNAAAAFLREEADSLQRELRAAETSLRLYQQRAHIMDAPEQARSQLESLARLSSDLAATRAERDALANLVRQLRTDSTAQAGPGPAVSRRLMAFPSLLRDQSTSVLLGALAQAESERAALLIRRRPTDPDVQVMTDRIRDIESQLQGIGQSFLQSLSNQVASLESEASQVGTKLDSLPEKSLQVARRERDTKVLNDLWVLVQTRLKEAEITGAVGDPGFRVVETAAVPTAPIGPRLLLNTAISLVLGALLGILAGLAMEYRNRSVRSRADVLAAAGLQVLGAIPRASRPRLAPWRRHGPRMDDGRHPEGQDADGPAVGLVHTRNDWADGKLGSLLVTHPGTRGAYLESFNQLFANLVLMYQDCVPKTLVFTSPLPGDGKTLTAINFAIVGAFRRLRMLLVDADLRCGAASAVLGYSGATGLAELLEGNAQVGDVVQRVSLDENSSLMVLPSGALQLAPGRLLTVDHLRTILQTLTPDFDFIVIDTPPVNLLADAALIASASDGVLLVVRAGQTLATDVKYAMDQLIATHAPVLGTLLNDIDLRHHSRDDDAYRYIADVERYEVSSR